MAPFNDNVLGLMIVMRGTRVTLCDGLGRLSLFMSWVGRFDSRGTAVPLTELVILLCVWEQQQAAVSPAWLCVFCLLLPPP